MAHIFKSSYSWQMLVATACILALIVYAVYAICVKIALASMTSYSFVAGIFVMILLLCATLYAFASQIMAIHIDDNEVVIKKMIGKVIIPRGDIIQVSLLRHQNWDIRVCGISGLFGHIGLFWNCNKGFYRAYAKDGNSTFLIETSKKKYLVSCDNHEQALSILRGTTD